MSFSHGWFIIELDSVCLFCFFSCSIHINLRRYSAKINAIEWKWLNLPEKPFSHFAWGMCIFYSKHLAAVRHISCTCVLDDRVTDGSHFYYYNFFLRSNERHKELFARIRFYVINPFTAIIRCTFFLSLIMFLILRKKAALCMCVKCAIITNWLNFLVHKSVDSHCSYRIAMFLICARCDSNWFDVINDNCRFCHDKMV